MQDKEVRAYAQATATVQRAFKRHNDLLGANIVNEAARFPARGFMMALQDGLKRDYITPEDHRLIASYLDVLDGPVDNEEDEEPLGYRQGCNWWVLYYQWQRLMTAKEAADELGVTRQRISALKKAGKLDYVTVDGHDYFTCASVTQRRIQDEEPESPENDENQGI